MYKVSWKLVFERWILETWIRTGLHFQLLGPNPSLSYSHKARITSHCNQSFQISLMWHWKSHVWWYSDSQSECICIKMTFLAVKQDGCCSGSDKPVNIFFVKKKCQTQYSSGNVTLTGVRVQRSENNSINFGMDMGFWPGVVSGKFTHQSPGTLNTPIPLTLSYCISFPSQGSFILVYFETHLKILFLILHHMTSYVENALE